MATLLSPRELTQQELSIQVEKAFGQFPYRKISYHNDRREVILQFDYPDAQNQKEFEAAAADFTDATGWSAQINPSTTHNAVSLLLSSLFGERIAKVSYHVDKKTYAITLTASAQDNDKELSDQFYAATGWNLSINGQQLLSSAALPPLDAPKNQEMQGVFYPCDKSVECVEQNLAFSCIDQTFEDLPHKPDKKSLKQNSEGKYLELSFISPAIGYRYHKELVTHFQTTVLTKMNYLRLHSFFA